MSTPTTATAIRPASGVREDDPDPDSVVVVVIAWEAPPVVAMTAALGPDGPAMWMVAARPVIGTAAAVAMPMLSFREVRLTSRLAIDLLRCASARCRAC